MKWSILGVIIISFLLFITSVYAFSFNDVFSRISKFFGRITGYVTNVTEACPYECCFKDPTYQEKECEYPKVCEGYKCVIVETTTTTIPSTTTPIVVNEGVKCVFVNSDSEQKCFTNDWKFSCAGVGSCVVYVSGVNGAKITWKSSCSGEAYTVIDAYDETIGFKCEVIATTTQPQIPIPAETTTPPLSTCKDSDGGKNYYVKGTAKDPYSEKTDYCSSEKYLDEYWCQGSIIWITGSVFCQYGCKDGACLPQPTPVCGNGICEDDTEKANCPQDCKIRCYQDSDCGQITTKKICDYPVASPEAKLPNVPYACTVESNYRCENPGTYDSRCISGEGRSCVPCQSGCQDGVCIAGETQTVTCTDSDGINYYNKGYIESNGMKDFDNCRVINSNTDYYDTEECSGENCYVLESSCTPSGTAYSYVWKCPNSCKDGACIKGEEVREQVKCIFANPESMQKCYNDDGRFGCAGIGTCIVEVYGGVGTKLTWKSSCYGYAYTVIDGNNEYAEFKCETTTLQPTPEVPVMNPASEQVKCLFVNSVSPQKCYGGRPDLECEGVGSCVVNVNGNYGEKLMWKSSCGGFAYTVIDGNNEPAEFRCEASTTPTSVTEQVQCVFWNSKVLLYPHTTTENCYADGGFGCKWDGNVVEEEINGERVRYAHCIAEITGEKGTKLTWRGSCGGFAYTVIDGNNEKAEFKCIPETNVTEEQIIGKGFKKAYWQCYDGSEQTPVTGVTMQCWSSEYWQNHAKNFCIDHCKKIDELGIIKCGVNSFSVSEECYIGEEEFPFMPPEEVGGGKKIAMPPDSKMGDVILVYFYMDDCSYCSGMDDVLNNVSEELGIKIMKFNIADEKELVKSYNIVGVPTLLLLVYTSDGIKENMRTGKADAPTIVAWVNEIRAHAGSIPTREEPIEEILICKDACPSEGKCYPFGYRKEGKFCSDDGMFKEQFKDDSTCENNFECKTNVCVDGKCMSSGLIQKILNWFRKLFGSE